jgi:hypothetical protein
MRHTGQKQAEGQDQQTERKKKTWEKITENITDLHKNWNEYESNSALADKEANFLEKELNQLTEAVEEKKLLPALQQANQFSLNLAQLYEAHNAQLGFLKEIKAYTRQVIYLTRKEVKEEERLALIEEINSLIKKLTDKEEIKDRKQQLQEAVTDLKIAVENNNSKVVEVKGELILNQLNDLQNQIE